MNKALKEKLNKAIKLLEECLEFIKLDSKEKSLRSQISRVKKQTKRKK